MVIFWSPSRVARALREGSLGERDKFRLLVATTVFGAVFGSLGIFYSARIGATGVVTAVVALGINLAGLYSAFGLNQKGDDVHFIERLACLGFPISVRVLLTGYGLYYVVMALAAGHQPVAIDTPTEQSTFWMWTYLLILLVEWKLIRRYVTEIALRQPA